LVSHHPPRYGVPYGGWQFANSMDLPLTGPLGLARLSLTDKSTFDAAFRTLAQPISDYSFASSFCWGMAMGLYFARAHRHICLFANGSDLTMLMPPLAEAGATPEDLKRCLADCFETMDAWNQAHGGKHLSRIEYVSDEMLERINTIIDGDLRLSAAPMGGDYIYPIANMIDLAGKSLKSKRHSDRKDLRIWRWRGEPHSDDHGEPRVCDYETSRRGRHRQPISFLLRTRGCIFELRIY